MRICANLWLNVFEGSNLSGCECDKLARATKLTAPEGMETAYEYDMLSRKTAEVQDAAQVGFAIKVTWKVGQWHETAGI